MATAVANHRVTEYLKAADDDAKRALEMAVAETERLRQDSQVEIDENGIKHANYASLWRMAQMYAAMTMTPEHFRGKPADCFLACELSIRLGVSVFMLMQGMYVVKNKPGFEAKLVIALANASKKFRGPIRWREPTGSIKDGTRRWCAYAVDRETGDELEQELTWKEVAAEGWNTKAGSKWVTIPELMGKYRTASWLVRTYCPEVTMGIPTVDEIRDSADRPEGEIQQVDIDAIEKALMDAPQQTAWSGESDQTASDEAAVRQEFSECLFKMTEAREINQVAVLEARAKELALSDDDTRQAEETAEQARGRIRGARGGRKTESPTTLLGDEPDDVAAAYQTEGM